MNKIENTINEVFKKNWNSNFLKDINSNLSIKYEDLFFFTYIIHKEFKKLDIGESIFKGSINSILIG